MSETTVTTTDYVRAAIAGDAIKAKEIFNQLMAPKVTDAVDARKTEIAQNYFGEKPEIESSAAVQTANQDDTTDEVVDDEATETNSKEEEANENA